MTVRVNKSSFNIREKLSELGRKFGLKGSELAAAETVQEARDLVSAGRKNYFINGSALVWQRGTSGISNSAYNNYGCDRWWLANGATSVDRSTTVPSGFQYSMKYTSNGGGSTVGQAIELTATGISQFEAGKEYTLSVWARTDSGESSLGFIVFYRNSKYSNTNQVNWNPWAPTVGRMTTEWKKFTYTFTAPTVNSNNQILATEFSFNKTAYFTGFQFEKGRNATEFEHRSYAEELALCKRYYQKIGDTATNEITLGGYSVSGSQIYHSIQLPVEMRAVPDLSQVGSLYAVRSNQPGSLNSHVGRKGFGLSWSTTGDGNYLLASNANAYFVLNAEL